MKLITITLFMLLAVVTLIMCNSCSQATPEIQLTYTLQIMPDGQWVKIVSTGDEGEGGHIKVICMDDGGKLHSWRDLRQDLYVVYSDGTPSATISRHPNAIVFSIPKPNEH